MDVRDRLLVNLRKNLGLYEPISMPQFIMDVTSLDRRLTKAYAVTANSTAKKGYNRF